MAESAVTFLFDQLSLLLQHERRLLGGIGKDAEYIRDELGEMRAFLRAADEKEESNPQFKEWVKKVREITYDTEDLLEIYMLRVPLPRRDSNGFNQYIKRMYASVKNLTVRHQVAYEFQKIKLRAKNVSKNGQKYKDMYDFKDEGSSNLTYDTRGDALLLEETDVLGIEKPKKQLVDWLMQSDDGLTVISVVGMGGSGKTTLVKKIYDDASVKANFDSHVWVTVSESFKLEHLLRNIISHLATEAKLQPPQNLEAMTNNDMKEYVYTFLKDRTYIDHPLTDEKSEELFYKKAFPGNSCPAYLNEISKNILRRCHGLPLAIVVIGGLLATKHNNLEDWKMFERTIGLELQGDSLKTMNKLLSLSYYNLPYYLKACFLYLSIFQEDELLSKWEVIRLWIAEGFVVENDGMTREEVAETYLKELLNRSLIQVADTHLDGRPRKFRIHDILREYIISKSREHNLLAIACGEEMNGHDKIRHMAIDATYTDTKESYNVKNLRSLFWLGYAHSNTGLIFQKVLGGRCRLLKVLNIRGAPIDSIPHEVFKLYCLKYLCLRSTNIKVIPKAIGNLQNLETLDLKKSKVTEIPIEILKLHKLRNLLVYSYNFRDLSSFNFVVQSFKAPFEIGSNLTSLQKLCYIDADEKDGIQIVGEIGKLTQLRKLCITKLRRKDGMDLCSSLVKLTNLRTLGIYSIEEDELMDLDHSVPPSTFSVLRSLCLHGRLEKLPQWTHFLDGLTELYLSWSRLKEDPLQHLGVLPNLVALWMFNFSYEGKELIFQGGHFQKLKKLDLDELSVLRYVRVEMNSMPRLEKLRFRDCEVMEELPEGIQHLTNLQLVEFDDMPEKFNERVVEQKSKLAHVSKVEIWDRVDSEWRQRQM
ncbi:disease resistance protein RPM1-like [Henckelia pumila]|uniref:disease resistance protein RPM1-like n=1 Tax=Henckelia pumila TaxID=405737 RepID=UPI003C6E7F75